MKYNNLQNGGGDRQPIFKKGVIFSAIALFLILFSFNLVSSQPPFTQVQQSPEGAGYLDLLFSPSSYHKLGDDLYIHTHVHNGTTGLLITSGIDCYYHTYNHQLNSGEHIDTGILSSYGDGYYNYTNGSLINQIGQYSVLMWCNGTEEGGFSKYSFEVTSTGNFKGSLFYIILLTSLAVFFLGLTVFVDEEFFVYISGVLFLVGGIFIMINGLDVMNDVNTRYLAFIYLGIGMLFTVGAYVYNSYSKHGEKEEY